MVPSRWQWLPVAVFAALVIACTWLALILSFNQDQATFTIVAYLAVFFPALFALLLCLIFPGRKASFQQLGLQKLGQPKWYGLALIQPTLMMVVGYLVTWAVGLIQFSPNMALVNSFGGPILFVMIIFLLAIGEEIGWRGFLQPRLTALFGLKRALILTGVIWAAWHASFFLLVDSVGLGGNFFLNLGLFTFGLICVYSVLIGSVRAGSGSLWPAIIWHTTWNIVWIVGQGIFSIQRPGWSYVGNDSGIACLLMGAILIFWTWRQFPIFTSPLSSLDR